MIHLQDKTMKLLKKSGIIYYFAGGNQYFYILKRMLIVFGTDYVIHVNGSRASVTLYDIFSLYI